MGGHGDPFIDEFAPNQHPEGYKWNIHGKLIVGVVEDPAHLPPKPLHWSIKHVMDVSNFNSNKERQGVYQEAIESYKTTYG